MAEYKLLIYPRAQQDLAEIVDYLNTLSPQAALDCYDALCGEIEKLRTLPLRFAPARDPQLRARGYRVMPIHSYLVFYVVSDDVVQIRRILYQRRHYAALL